MDAPLSRGLTKAERLCGKTAVSSLMSTGRWGSAGCLKFCALVPGGAETPRIIVSVPKKLFKRAVRRNLLKRRIRESYRVRKDLLQGCNADILFAYNTQEILSTEEIGACVADILTQISGWKR